MLNRLSWLSRITVIAILSIPIASAEEKVKEQAVVVSVPHAELKVQKDVVATVKKGTAMQATEFKDGWVWYGIHGVRGWVANSNVIKQSDGVGSLEANDNAIKQRQVDVELFLSQQGKADDTAWVSKIEDGNAIKFLHFFKQSVTAEKVRAKFGESDCVVKNAISFRPSPPGGKKAAWEGLRGERWYYGSVAVWVHGDIVWDYVLWENIGDPGIDEISGKSNKEK